MKTKLIVLLAYILTTNLYCQTPPPMQNITKNGMQVSWQFAEERIFFEMSAPTEGWVTIGFNTGSGIQGAYLLMGHIVEGKPAVVEHYTSSPGNYQALSAYGLESQVKDVEILGDGEQTSLRFSLPAKAVSTYRYDLKQGLTYQLILAYSREDDFQHHSMMRTSVQIIL